MITLLGTNVNDLYHNGMLMLRKYGRKSDSRNGPVTVMDCPVMSIYDSSTQRVLFDPARDANPFFHLFECLWMLSGQNDAKMLDAYVATFSKRYADDGVIHGAYGHRWRSALGIDQLDEVVTRLRSNRDDRQAVIQMWDARHQLSGRVGEQDLTGDWRDRPCNTHVYLRVREDYDRDIGHVDSEHPTRKYVLDLTVMCRSNDIVWGAYGANAVHFSFLQEYLAGRIGVGVGKMYQLSNNYHAYDDVFLPLVDEIPPMMDDPYRDELVVPLPIGDSFYHWDEDLSNFMRWHAAGLSDMTTPTYNNRWFDRVAAPMCMANKARRAGWWDMAVTRVRQVEADDWRRAAMGWIGRHRR